MECVRCVCVWLGRRGWIGGEWMRGLDLGFMNPVGTREVLGHVSGLRWCRSGEGNDWKQGLEQWGGVMSELFVYMTGPGISVVKCPFQHPHRYYRFSVSGKLSSRIVLKCLFHNFS